MPTPRFPTDASDRPAAAHARHGRLATAMPLVMLAALVALGIALDALGLFDWRAALARVRGHPGGVTLAAAIVATQTVLYTLALPGSTLLWVAAVLYPPPVATLVLAAGGTAGAFGAYLFARRVTRVTAARAGEHRLYRLLEAQGDFFTLCALRILPGMPHSLLNYTAGTLRLPLPSFLAATALGHAVKSFLYSSAIAGIATSAALSDLLRADILVPLFALTLLLLLGRRARRRWRRPRD
jgi:uncharacterized membrane protein YdjX (TVP38/TMEM64 family)